MAAGANSTSAGGPSSRQSRRRQHVDDHLPGDPGRPEPIVGQHRPWVLHAGRQLGEGGPRASSPNGWPATAPRMWRGAGARPGRVRPDATTGPGSSQLRGRLLRGDALTTALWDETCLRVGRWRPHHDRPLRCAAPSRRKPPRECTRLHRYRADRRSGRADTRSNLHGGRPVPAPSCLGPWLVSASRLPDHAGRVLPGARAPRGAGASSRSIGSTDVDVGWCGIQWGAGTIPSRPSGSDLELPVDRHPIGWFERNL